MKPRALCSRCSKQPVLRQRLKDKDGNIIVNDDTFCGQCRHDTDHEIIAGLAKKAGKK